MDGLVKSLSTDVYTFFVLIMFGALVIFAALLKDFLVAGLRMKISKGLKNPNFGKHVKKIYDELVVWRVKADASRAYLLQFHNGEVFEATTPRWKLTQTYVSNSLGFDEPHPVFENTDVTTAWDFVGTAIGEFRGSLPEGFTPIRSSTSVCNNECALGKGVYLCVVDEITSEQGRLKAMLMSRGIKAMVFTPVNDRRRRAFGILGLAYCTNSWHKDINNSRFDACGLCSASELIATYLEGKKQSKFQLIYDYFKGTNNG